MVFVLSEFSEVSFPGGSFPVVNTAFVAIMRHHCTHVKNTLKHFPYSVLLGVIYREKR